MSRLSLSVPVELTGLESCDSLVIAARVPSPRAGQIAGRRRAGPLLALDFALQRMVL